MSYIYIYIYIYIKCSSLNYSTFHSLLRLGVLIFSHKDCLLQFVETANKKKGTKTVKMSPSDTVSCAVRVESLTVPL